MNFSNSSNLIEFTVAEFSRSIKRVVEDSFGYVRIKGEITGFKRASSGHCYFTLKDENATLSSVLFRGSAQLVNFEISDGLQVCAVGKITTFEGRSNYQIIVEKLEIAGVGAILEMIEKRRKKLFEEGLFDTTRKKQLPFFPKIIGVITSPTGAVIEDIKHRIEARCPTKLIIYPSLVQGEKAAAEVIAGIKFFNSLKNEQRPQVLIIARGGGSFEDLLAFNDENLVRQIFKSEIPIISAVGHETDVTLIDYVADLRAPTPTAAAEMATPILADLKNQLNFCQEKLNFLPQNFLAQNFLHLKNLQRYIVNPAQTLAQIAQNFSQVEKKFNFAGQNFLERKSQKLASLQISNQTIFAKINLTNQKVEFAFERLNSRLEAVFKNAKISLENLIKLLKSNDYHQVLQRGFALLKNQKGDLISSVSKIKIDEEFVVELFDGKALATIKTINKNA